MKASIVRIGNSSGVRIPKAVLKQLDLEGEVEMTVEDGKLVIAPLRLPRQGWDSAFARMAACGDDAPLLDDGGLDNAHDDEWQW